MEGTQPRRQVATIRVEGMTCGACSGTVERALASVSGVHVAAVSCVTHLARVEYDPLVTGAAQLEEAIEDVGFGAQQAEVQELPVSAGGAKSASEAPHLSVELKIEGMTCAACSGTIERHLRSLPGVAKATVSLVLGRAFVICDGSVLTPEKLQAEVDDVGFDAEVVASGPAESCAAGRASLHVQLSAAPGAQPPGIGLLKTVAPPAVPAAFDVAARGLPGVLSCQAIAGGHRRVVYDPNTTGARELLDRLRAEVEEHSRVEWVSVNADDEHLQTHLDHMHGLRRDVSLAVPPAAVVFTLTILLPSLGLDQDHMGFLSCRLHHGVDVLVLLILAVSTPVQLIIGRRFHSAAYKAIRRKSPNMDVLVSIATNTAYFYSVGLIVYCLLMPETPGSHSLAMATSHFFTMGPILIAVVLLGKFLEARAKLTAMKAMTDLPASMPVTTVLCAEDGERTIPVELVELGDVLRIFAGGKIPVDGLVCSQSAAHVDESMLTGESVPIEKKQGELLLGGSTCVSGGCLMRVTRVGGDTMLGQMVALVQEAQASKADVQRMADKVARIFVPTVVALSAATFVVWGCLVFSGAVHVPASLETHASEHGSSGMALTGAMEAQDSLKLLFAMKFGMAVLMIACPCAMGLATPMAVLVATGVAAKKGILVKSAAALETSAKLDAIVLDKTGTITGGAPTIQAAVCVAEAFDGILGAWRALRASSPAAPVSNGASPSAGASPTTAPAVRLLGGRPDASGENAKDIEACFWWLLGTLECASDHPVAKCILSAVHGMSGLPPILPPKDFEYLSGRGVRCLVTQLGGLEARVGNLRFYEEAAAESPPRKEPIAERELLDWVIRRQQEGHTVVLVHVCGELLGAVALRDPIRPNAEWVVDYLTNRLGLEVWLCTGDNTATAQTIAREVGIMNVVAEALPSTKADCVRQLQRKGGSTARRVGFVGDGINDSIALAQADVGIAIGVGAQVAVEAADVTLVRSELSDCVTFLALSKRTFSTIVLNFFWAFCFNFVCLPMAAGLFYPAVHIPPLAAGIGMASSSCLVVLTSLALRHFEPPQRQPRRLGKSSYERVPLTSSSPPTLSDVEPQVIGRLPVEP